jgi:hypothetical protein
VHHLRTRSGSIEYGLRQRWKAEFLFLLTEDVAAGLVPAPFLPATEGKMVRAKEKARKGKGKERNGKGPSHKRFLAPPEKGQKADAAQFLRPALPAFGHPLPPLREARGTGSFVLAR